MVDREVEFRLQSLERDVGAVERRLDNLPAELDRIFKMALNGVRGDIKRLWGSISTHERGETCPWRERLARLDHEAEESVRVRREFEEFKVEIKGEMTKYAVKTSIIWAAAGLVFSIAGSSIVTAVMMLVLK